MSIDLSELNLPFAVTQVLEKLLKKSPSRESVLKKMDAQLRSLRILREREREVDMEAAEELHKLLLKMLRDTADSDEETRRLAVLACQYYYLKQDVVPDVGHGAGLDDDRMVADAIAELLNARATKT